MAQDDIPRTARKGGQDEAVDAEDEGQDVQVEAQCGILYMYMRSLQDEAVAQVPWFA